MKNLLKLAELIANGDATVRLVPSQIGTTSPAISVLMWHQGRRVSKTCVVNPQILGLMQEAALLLELDSLARDFVEQATEDVSTQRV